ncbi:MAG: AAA family ATPase [Geodermatophilaceae bacterium]
MSSHTLLRPREDRPAKGWRRALHRASGGSLNPGLSATEQRERDVMRRIATPVEGCHRIAVISLKGGVGKTTTTACLGLTLAHLRGDRVIALDANPDTGTLAERLAGRGGKSVSDLLAGVDDVHSFTDIASYTSLAERLQVLGSQQQPEMSHAFDEDSYRAVDDALARFFNIVLVDSGTGLLHSAMTGTLDMANSLVVVAGPTVDGAGQAAKTLDWLVVHGYGELVARSVAVICSVRPDTRDVNVELLRAHFAARCRRVVEIPYDPHLATGGRIDRAEWRRPTADAFIAVAAAVAEGFAHPATDPG